MKRLVLIVAILAGLILLVGGLAIAQQVTTTVQPQQDLAVWDGMVEVRINWAESAESVRVNSLGSIQAQDGCEFVAQPNAIVCDRSVESVLVQAVPGSRVLQVQVQGDDTATPTQKILIPVMPSVIRTLFASVGGTEEEVQCAPQNDFGWQCELPVGRLDVNPPLRLSTFWGYALEAKGFGGLKPPPDVFSARFTPDGEKSVQVECAIMVTLDVNCSLEEYGVFLVDFVEPEPE